MRATGSAPTSHWTAGLLTGILVIAWCPGLSANRAEAADPADRLNVILISLDTVRPDHLGCYGYARETTPNIDRIATDGTIFTQAFSQATVTFASQLSIFTSQYPRTPWLMMDSVELEPSIETLVEILGRHGYQTAGFTDFMTGHLHTMAESRAFQAFDHLAGNVKLSNLPDEVFTWLQQHQAQPFFLFLHGFDAHEPHVVPIRYDANRFDPTYHGQVPSTTHDLAALVAAMHALDVADLQGMSFDHALWPQWRDVYRTLIQPPDGLPPSDLKHLQAVYDAQIYYLDQGLGRLFQALENLGLADRTLIILYSDHGQAFGEHGPFVGHGRVVYDETTRMVLIVRDPRLKRRGRKVRRIVSGIDIMPTMLELLDLPIPKSAKGRSLVPLLRTGQDPQRKEVAISFSQDGVRAIRTPTWKLIDGLEGMIELYNMKKDPREQRNRITRHPKVAQRLRLHFEQLRLAHEIEVIPPQDPAWIREHGYW